MAEDIQVLLDDGTGTFPTDVTAFVRMTDGYTLTVGRSDEQGQVAPSTLALTLDNAENTFYGTGVGWDESPWDSGPWGGGGEVPLTLDQQIRLISDGVTRFTGYLQSFPLQWPGGGEEWSTIALTATDVLARFARLDSLGSSADEEILRDSPAGYYEFTGDSGSTVEYDASGFGSGSLVVVQNAGAAPVWGAAYGSVDGTTGVQLTVPSGGAAGSFLTSGSGGSAGWVSSDLHLEVVFKVTANQAVNPLVRLGLDTAIAVTAGGSIIAYGTTVGSGYADGLKHVVSVEATMGATMDVWVDGVKVGSGLSFTTVASAFVNFPTIGSDTAASASNSAGAYVVGRLNFGPRLSDARVAAHHAALLDDFAGESGADRLTRVAGYLSIDPGVLDTSDEITCGPAAQAGKGLLDVVGEVEDATQGVVWVDPSGDLTSVNGITIAGDVTPALTLDANYAASDTAVQNDLAQVVNDATGKTTSGENIITARNLTSITEHGRYTQDYQFNVESDDLAFQLTWWKVNAYGEPHPRMPTLTIDLLTLNAVDPSKVADALAVTIGSYIQITGLPEQSPVGATADLIVQGYTEFQSSTAWTLQVNTTVREIQSAWVLDDTTWGVLDDTTKLYV